MALKAGVVLSLLSSYVTYSLTAYLLQFVRLPIELCFAAVIGLLFCAEAAIAKAKPQTTNRLLIRRANAGNFTVRQ
jgi:hypothetical protein